MTALTLKPIPVNVPRKVDSYRFLVPSLGDTFHPSFFIVNGFTLQERKVYYKILQYNHDDEPDRLQYLMRYNEISDDYQKWTNKIIKDIEQNIGGKPLFMQSDVLLKILKHNKNFHEKYPEFRVQENALHKVFPFTMVSFMRNTLEITLSPVFKEIIKLICTKGGYYNKEHLSTLIQFKHKYSDLIYWLIRTYEHSHSHIDISMDKLKAKLGITGKGYDRPNKLAKKVLEKAQEDLRGSYCEFDFKLCYKGKRFSHFHISFLTQSEKEEFMEKDIRYKFETKLKTAGFSHQERFHIRQLIINQFPVSATRPDYYYNADYVMRTIAIVDNHEKLGKIKKDKKSFLYKALTEGYFLDQIAKHPYQPGLGEPVLRPTPVMYKKNVFVPSNDEEALTLEQDDNYVARKSDDVVFYVKKSDDEVFDFTLHNS